MTYLQDKKQRQDKQIKIIFIFIVLALLFLGIAKIQKYILSGVSKALGILPSQQDIFGGNFISRNLKTRARLSNENETLKKTISAMEYTESQSAQVRAENEKLKNILQSGPATKSKTLVSALEDSYVYGTLIVNSGKNKNIKTGDILAGTHSGLLGFVTGVTDNTATVSLIESNNSAVDVVTLNSGIRITVRSESRGAMSSNIPRDTNLEIGESVVLADRTEILVGTVTDVLGDEKTPFKKVLIMLADQYRYSPYLYVVSQ